MEALQSGCARRAMVALMGAGDAESAAILTPYNGQVRLIRRILKEHTGDLYAKVQRPFHLAPHSLPSSPGWRTQSLHCEVCPVSQVAQELLLCATLHSFIERDS